MTDAESLDDQMLSWSLDRSGEALMRLHPDVSSPSLIGSGRKFDEIASHLRSKLSMSGQNLITYNTSDTTTGSQLYGALRFGRQATMLVTVFSGDHHPDLLTSVALGAHTAVDKEMLKVAGKQLTLPRQVYAIVPAGLGEYAPSLAKSLPSACWSDGAEAADRMAEAYVKFRRKLRR